MSSIPERLTQAYQQAPWRVQTQRGVLVLIVVILAAAVAWMMLSVTVQAGAAGVELQNLDYDKENTQRQIADLHVRLADATSSNRMESRAKEMGFVRAGREDIVYMVVPGYAGRQPELDTPPPALPEQRRLLKYSYTQSLWEFMYQGILTFSSQPIQDLPGGILK